MNVVARKAQQQIARPLKVLVPLIQNELVSASEAGLGHYCRAGDLLNEAKEQVTEGSWSRWLTQNFHLSRNTANKYMRLATLAEQAGGIERIGADTIEAALGHKPRRERHAKWKPLKDETDAVNVVRLAGERQRRIDEINLHRELALQLIDLGYRALATKLHPDRGGSQDAMMRLNTVRDELKSVAATRRFV